MGGGAFMDPGGAVASSDAGEARSAAVDDLGVRDLDRELERLLAEPALVGVAPERHERLERLADELFALLRARLERHLKDVMENVAVEAATAALRRIEPRRARLRRVRECEDPNDEVVSENS